MHRSTYLLFCLELVLWPPVLVAQVTQLWSQTTGTTTPGRGGCVVIDSSDNVYVVGSASGALDGQTSTGSTDIALQKYNSLGARQWTQMRGTTGIDNGYAGEHQNLCFL